MSVISADEAAATFPQTTAPQTSAPQTSAPAPTEAAKIFTAVAKFEPKKDDQLALVKGALYTCPGTTFNVVHRGCPAQSLTSMSLQIILEAGG